MQTTTEEECAIWLHEFGVNSKTGTTNLLITWLKYQRYNDTTKTLIRKNKMTEIFLSIRQFLLNAFNGKPSLIYVICRLANAWRELYTQLGDHSATSQALVGDWLPIDWRWAATSWRLVGDCLAVGWRSKGDLLKSYCLGVYISWMCQDPVIIIRNIYA